MNQYWVDMEPIFCPRIHQTSKDVTTSLEHKKQAINLDFNNQPKLKKQSNQENRQI